MTDDPGGVPVTDPHRIRALAHPLRLALLELLGDGPATATECAASTGDSVASCSFHLRMLAKYGWIEPAERRGREKPWQLVTQGRDLRPETDNPESMRACVPPGSTRKRLPRPGCPAGSSVPIHRRPRGSHLPSL